MTCVWCLILKNTFSVFESYRGGVVYDVKHPSQVKKESYVIKNLVGRIIRSFLQNKIKVSLGRVTPTLETTEIKQFDS